MSMETSSTCAALAATPATVAKPPGSAGDTAGESSGLSFGSVLATSMEPPANARAEAANTSTDDAPAPVVPPAPAPDVSAFLAQTLNWVGQLPEAETTVPAIATAACRQDSLVTGLAAAADPRLAQAPGLGKADHKVDAKAAGGKPTTAKSMADMAPPAGSLLLEDMPEPWVKRAVSVGSAAARALQDTGNQTAAKSVLARASESRAAAEFAGAQARGEIATRDGSVGATGVSMLDGGAMLRESNNTRSVERSPFRPLHASEGSATAGSWAEQALSGGSTAGAATYALDAGTPVPAAAVAEKLHYWVSRGVQNAELQLDAFGGGSVEVSISVNGNQAQVEFRSDQAEARKLLQDSMPHLEDMLNEEGLQLSGGFVGTTAQQESGTRERNSYPTGKRTSMVAIEPPAAGPGAASGRMPGLAVDVFV